MPEPVLTACGGRIPAPVSYRSAPSKTCTTSARPWSVPPPLLPRPAGARLSLDSPPSPLPGSLPYNWRSESGSRSCSSRQRWPFVIAVIAIEIKARRSGLALSGPGRKFALSLLPPIAVAGLLTVAFVRLILYHLLPSVWLRFYGAAAISGTVTLFTPACGNLAMALAVGGLHIVFGIWIARKHDG